MRPRVVIKVGIVAALMSWSTQAAAQETDEPTPEIEETETTGQQDSDGDADVLTDEPEGEESADEPHLDPQDTPSTDDAVPVEIRSQQQRLTLMLTGNVAGNFARIDCREQTGDQELYWAKHAGYYEALEEVTRNSDVATPIALNVGNSLFPGSLGRYLINDPDASSDRLSEVIAQVPMDVHGVGNREFAAPRSAMVDFADAMKERGIDVQAANLECADFGGAEVVCEAIETSHDDKPFRVIEREGIRIAVTTVMAPGVLDWLAPSQREGIRILDPIEVLPALVEKMKADADLVVVQYQVPSDNSAPVAYDMARQIEGIDLVIASHLIETSSQGQDFDPNHPTAGGRTAVIEATTTGTPIISANSTAYGIINVELDVIGRGGDDPQWSLRSVVPRRILVDSMPVHPSTGELLRSTIDEFCADWGDAIGDHSELDEPFEMADLERFILNVTRFSTDSEVALSNRRAFRDEGQFPLTDQLTRADIYTTLPYENHLVTAKIPGSVLRGLRGRLSDDIVATGLAVVNDEVRINGRAIQPDRLYRVAINDYLAEGGDGVLSPDVLDNAQVYHPDWSEAPPIIGDIVIEYVASERHLQRGDVQDRVSAQNNFPDLARKFLWSLTGSLNASYNQVTVNNPAIEDPPGPGYEQSQLTVQSTDQITVDGRLTANADSRNHGWNNDLSLQYARARISDDTDVAEFEETRDQIRFRSRYLYQGWRAAQQDRWFVPVPLLEGQAESEFTVPDTRDWRRLDLRAIAGFSFQLFEPLDVRIGANVRQDVNNPDGEPTVGLNLSYTLARVSPVDLLDRPIQVESEVEYFYNDIGDLNIHEARSSNRVFFAVFDQFYFTTTFNAFLYRDDTVGEFGTNTELTIGINYQWAASRQSF